MKKMLAAIITFLLLLLPAAGDAFFLIRLKNGGQLTTPLYWIEGRMILFYYAGGIAGMERKEVERVEKYEEQTGVFGPQAAGTTALPPPPPKTEAPGPGAPPDTKEGEEKVNIQAYKEKKDQMTVELDDMLEKMREATARKDEAAREKAMEEIRAKSGQIYKLTDEVTKKNRGVLPEGWWEK